MMKIVDLDGCEQEWSIGKRATGRTCSQLHKDVRKFLHTLMPTIPMHEEVMIPVRSGSKLYLDFYIPMINMAVEAHGRQHYHFIQHFHKTTLNFLYQKRRDANKAMWCELNEIPLVILPYDKTEEEWAELIDEYN